MSHFRHPCLLPRPPRGHCLILNYVANFDAQSAVESFGELGNFDCQYFSELTREQTEEVLEEEAKIYMKTCNCLVICIFSRCENDGNIACKDKSISTEELIGYFHDVTLPNSISTSNYLRIPVFFFINNVNLSSLKPFHYFVRKCHLTICYNSSPASWLLQSLRDLYRICHLDPILDLQPLIVDICSNIEDLKLLRKGYRPEAYKIMSSYDRIAFRQLLLRHCTNTNKIQDHHRHNSEIKINDICYSMNNKRGRCLILNYNSISITDSLISHEIGRNDVNLLMDTFKLLNFDVEVYDDLTVNATTEILLEESSYDYSSMDCFVLFVIAECRNQVLNNIDKDVLVCNKEKTFSTDELLDYFSEQKCPSLAGKPKLIFFQHIHCVLDRFNQEMSCYNLGSSPYLNQRHFNQLPNEHFLLFVSPYQAYSSIEKTENVSKIEKYQNAVFILILCQILSDNWTKYDLMTMLHMVSIKLSYNTDHFYIDQRRNSYLKSSLTKLVHFGIDALKAQSVSLIPPMQEIFNVPKHHKKCFVIDQQNCEQSCLNEIELAFTKMNFHVKQLKDLTKAELKTLVEEECLAGGGSSEAEQDCVVFCIFANCKAFNLKCKSNEILRIRDLVGFASRDYGKKLDYVLNRMYFLINDKNQSDCNQDQCFTSLTLNIHLNINLNPNLSFIGRLTNALRNIVKLYYKPEELLDQLSMSTFEYNPATQFDLSESVPEDFHVKTTWKLAKNILTICTNFNSNCNVINELEENTDSLMYQMPNKDKGKCVILSFELPDYKQIEAIDKDVEKLEGIFVGLSFEVDSFTNLTCKQTWDCLTRESQNFEWSSSCFALCLVTRFENGYFACVDGKINFNSVLKLFENSLPLEDKPKILIIQDPYHSHLWKEGDADMFSYLQSGQYDLPKDCLIAHSAFNDRSITNRFNPQGSWFVQILNLLLTFSRKYDLLTLFRMITLSLVQPPFLRQHRARYHNYPNVYVKSTLTRMILFTKSAKERAFEFDADISMVNRTFREANQEVKLSTRRDALFYSRGRGKCLIVKNCDATQSDVDLLESTFSGINFDVQIEEVHDRNSMKLLMRKESRRNHQEFGCLVLFILVDESHILSGDTSRDNLIEYFTGHWSLIGKPKLLFVLGGKQQNLANSKEMPDNNEESKYQGSFRIPKYADFMFFHSELVSSTIQSLSSILSDKSNHHDLLTLLIGSEMNRIESSQIINSTLTHLVSFASSDFTLELSEDQCFQLSSETLFLSYENRGKCLIFNNRTFTDPNLKERSGTERDFEILELVLGDVLKFKIDAFNDLSVQQTRDILEKESKTDYSQLECFAICFLSHGNENGVLHCNDGNINQSELVKSLVVNSSLDGKPKLLFVQACQGTSIDPGIRVTDSPTDISQDITLYHQPDLFVFSSSYPGHLSFRDSTGSWFIQSLCDAFLEHHHQFDLTTIATIVCRTVSYRSDSEGQGLKQIPFFHCTLTKPIVFA